MKANIPASRHACDLQLGTMLRGAKQGGDEQG